MESGLWFGRFDKYIVLDLNVHVALVMDTGLITKDNVFTKCMPALQSSVYLCVWAWSLYVCRLMSPGFWLIYLCKILFWLSS